MLPLVVSDRDEVGLVEQDVAGHQHRVREEPGRDDPVLLGLLLELRHPAELSEARHRAQQPGGLGVGDHVALDEDGRALGIKAGGEEHRGEVERPLAQVGRVVLDGDRVEVDDAEERVAELLGRGVLAEAAAVVAEVLRAGRLDAGEDPHRTDYRECRRARPGARRRSRAARPDRRSATSTAREPTTIPSASSAASAACSGVEIPKPA